MNPILYLGCVIALLVLGAYLANQRDARRRAALAAFAASKGWSYTDRDDTWATRFVGEPFGRGENRQARNVLRGRDQEHELVAFDYSFETRNDDSRGGSNKTVHRFSVAVLALPAWLPLLEVTPESLGTRIAGTLGRQDIELESEDFNRRYRVQAADPKFAFDVLNPRTMQRLLALPPLRLRVEGPDAFCWEPGRSEPVALLARLSALNTVLTGIPSYIWSDHTPGGASS